MPRVLIAGCGYVGTATADLFQAAGWEVEGWTHSEDSASQLSAKPYPVRAVDITDRDAVQNAGRTFNTIIHCASTGGGGAESYRRIYSRGATNLIQILQPDRFLFTSSTSVYAQTNGDWVDEDSAAEPQHETGKILRETEAFVRQSSGIVARLAGIYGPGRSALLRKFLTGEARVEDGGERYQNQAHRDDIASALLHLAKSPEDPGLVNVTDDEPLTQRECYEWLAAKLNRPLPLEGSQTRDRKRGLSNKRVSNQKMRTLGWTPQFPSFPAGMEKSVLLTSRELGS
jgi:nucleoside-diphosphate-sugar epimerase